MTNLVLTNKSNFPQTDADAIKQLAAVQAHIMQYLDAFVIQANQDVPEALQVWELLKGMNAAVEVYSG